MLQILILSNVLSVYLIWNFAKSSAKSSQSMRKSHRAILGELKNWKHSFIISHTPESNNWLAYLYCKDIGLHQCRLACRLKVRVLWCDKSYIDRSSRQLVFVYHGLQRLRFYTFYYTGCISKFLLFCEPCPVDGKLYSILGMPSCWTPQAYEIPLGLYLLLALGGRV